MQMKLAGQLGRALMLLGCLCWGGATAAAEADPHADLFKASPFPSAVQCGQCHPRVFSEWAVSNHAYASISPMFHKFEQRINDLTQGTIGTFCVRCHQQVGTQMNEAREAPLWARSPVAREGITCVTCHRVKAEFGKVNGERHVEPGDITAPVYNTGRGHDLPEVLANPDDYGLRSAGNPDGKVGHSAVIKFEQLGKSEFCVSCHQVAVNLGIKLEVVWDQYRGSPASSHGTQCQDCHMGKVPGRADGFETGPIAVINGRPVGDGTARHSNHMFFGPGYPIAHPGLFPFNPKSLNWSIEDWLAFDYRAGWGDAAWEDAFTGLTEPGSLPAAWQTREARERARVVVDQNLRALDYKRLSRKQVMENGSRIDGPFLSRDPRVGESLGVRYRITNTDDGHNLPSGSLGAQPEIWFNVALVDPDGHNVWESGYVDKAGDMADLHSTEVRTGRLEHDDQLFNLQTKFLTTNIKGTDREMYLPVNFDGDQLPFLRPAGVPTTVINHPPTVRMEGRSIPPLGWRDASYRVPGSAITKPGKYKLLARLRSRAEPIYFMRFVEATPDMEQSINQWMLDIHPYAAELEVK
ncbi:MAG TPA: multiheme c-type cytochrome [Solimonas sp.]|nr:multiheme c-type cytochrome [Solimonas sp.]